MKKLPSLSIFFPSYNDAKSLPQIIKKAYNIGPKVAKRFDVTAVNDGSTDDTQIVLTKLKQKYNSLNIIHHEKNQEYGGTLQSGFKNAKGEWIFYTDGDGQYDPRELTLLVDALTEYTDVVNGYKLTRSDPVIRKMLGSLYNWFLHIIYKLPISDVDCDFRLIRRSMLRKINLTRTSGIICLELVLKLKKAGARFKEVGVHHYKRPFGGSQFFIPKNVLKILYDNIIFYMESKDTSKV